MRRIFTACAIAAALQAADAKLPALPQEPPAITHAAKICTAKSAFGRPFAHVGYGHVDTTAGDDWAPFGKLTLENGAIEATASFRGAGDTAEADEALAKEFAKALDKAVTAKAHFPRRDAHGGIIVFHSAEDPDIGMVFEIRRSEDHVTAACTDMD